MKNATKTVLHTKRGVWREDGAVDFCEPVVICKVFKMRVSVLCFHHPLSYHAAAMFIQTRLLVAQHLCCNHHE